MSSLPVNKRFKNACGRNVSCFHVFNSAKIYLIVITSDFGYIVSQWSQKDMKPTNVSERTETHPERTETYPELEFQTNCFCLLNNCARISEFVLLIITIRTKVLHLQQVGNNTI